MRVVAWIWIGFWTIGAVVAGMGFHDSYWRFRNCFDEEGRCFDPTTSVVHMEQSGLVYFIIMAACVLAAVAAVPLLFHRRRIGGGG